MPGGKQGPVPVVGLNDVTTVRSLLSYLQQAFASPDDQHGAILDRVSSREDYLSVASYLLFAYCAAY